MQDNKPIAFFTNMPVERLCFYLMCILSAAPLLFAHYPPMVDIPQHAAQINTLNHLLFNPHYPFRDLFQINWSVPYWGAYLPLLLLSTFLPILLSIKLLLAAALIAIPFTASRLRAYFGGDPTLDWLALTIGYGFAFQWGLLTFLLGVPFVLTFLLYAFRYAENPSLRTGIALTLFTGLLLFMHLLIMAFGCGIAALYILAGKLAWKKKLLSILPFFIGIPIALGWLLSKISAGGMHTESGSWGLSLWRPLELVPSAIGQPFTYSTLAIGLLVFALPLLLGFRFTSDRPRILIFISLLGWLLLGPDYFFGNNLTYQRFAIFGIPLYLLLLTSPDKALSRYQKLGRSLFYILPVALVLGHCLRFATFELESQGYRNISSHMQPGKRTLILMFNNNSAAYYGHQFLHFPAWYQAETDGIVDFSFAMFSMQAGYKAEAEIPIHRGFEWFPNEFNWHKNKGWLYDYFVVRHPENIESVLFATTNCPVRLIANSGAWWLYGTDKQHCQLLK